MNMSRTAAIRESAGYVSLWGGKTSWTVSGPWSVLDLSGPSTTAQTDSYTKARRIATVWRAEIVMVLMGTLTRENKDDICHALYDHRCDGYTHTLTDYIAIGLENSK